MKIYLKETDRQGFNAGSKARVDADLELERAGYRPRKVTIYRPDANPLAKKIGRLLEIVRLRAAIGRGDTVFLQLPLYTFAGKKWIYRFLFGGHKGTINCLVHDIAGYRDGKGMEEELRYIISRCDTVIAHTPLMASKIAADLGMAPERVRPLGIFDYFTDDALTPANPAGKTVIFAGNLAQCTYLRRLGELPEELEFNIYGVYSDNVRESARCRYKGKFRPDNVGAIEGDWGLVWHGDALETSAGNIGEYLRIIASHKISLYLAAGKPVIVWDESSVADFIVANNLGIAVSSLFDVAPALAALTPEDHRRIAEGVAAMARKIRAGGMLTPLIEELDKN